MADVTDLQTMIEELEDKHDANFAALKDFTFGVLGCMKKDINNMNQSLQVLEEKVSGLGCMKKDINDMNQSLQVLEEKVSGLGCMKKDINDMNQSLQVLEEKVSGLSMQPDSNESGCLTDEMKDMRERIKALEDNIPGLSTQPKQSEEPSVKDFMHKFKKARFEVPSTLADVKDKDLREKLRPYYKENSGAGHKLNAVQMAFFTYFLQVTRAGKSSANSQVVKELFEEGIANGIWTRDYQPKGVKVPFQSHLKEKIRNACKRKLQDEATKQFVQEFTVDTD